ANGQQQAQPILVSEVPIKLETVTAMIRVPEGEQIYDVSLSYGGGSRHHLIATKTASHVLDGNGGDDPWWADVYTVRQPSRASFNPTAEIDLLVTRDNAAGQAEVDFTFSGTIL